MHRPTNFSNFCARNTVRAAGLSLLSAIAACAQTYSITPLTPNLQWESSAAGLNSAGAVIGASQQASGVWHAFVFNGQFADIGTLGGANSQSFAINASGEVVGASDLASGSAQHAFLNHVGQLYDLNSLIGSSSGWVLTAARSINDAGQIVGDGLNGGQKETFVLSPVGSGSCNPAEQPVCFTVAVWRGATPASGLVSSANTEPVVLSTNAQGQSVGSKSEAGETHAVVFQNGAATDLNSLIRADSGWTLLNAVAINDSGQITGNGLFQGRPQAYLLTPLQPQVAGASKGTASPALAGVTGGSNASTSNSSLAPLDSPTGTAGGVLSGNYPNPLLYGISAGPVVFGNGPGTIGQDNSFTFNSTNKELSLSGITNIHNSATLNLSKGTNSSSVLDLTESDYTGKILRVLQPSDQAKQTPTVYIDSGAGLYMRSWLILSGTTNGGTGDGYNIVPPSNDPAMLDIWADVGTGMQVRTAPIAGAYNYSNLDRYGNYTMSIESDGSLKWGATTRAALDTGLSRDSAGLLEVNQGSRGALADLKVRNLFASGAIQFSSAAAGNAVASLGGNSPAATPSQPFTWISVNLPDGSQGWIPVWK